METRIDSAGPHLAALRQEQQGHVAKPELPERIEADRAPAPEIQRNGFRLRVDQETHRVTALILDPETQDVIREVPPEEMRAASNVIRNLLDSVVDIFA